MENPYIFFWWFGGKVTPYFRFNIHIGFQGLAAGFVSGQIYGLRAPVLAITSERAICRESLGQVSPPSSFAAVVKMRSLLFLLLSLTYWTMKDFQISPWFPDFPIVNANG